MVDRNFATPWSHEAHSTALPSYPGFPWCEWLCLYGIHNRLRSNFLLSCLLPAIASPLTTLYLDTDIRTGPPPIFHTLLVH